MRFLRYILLLGAPLVFANVTSWWPQRGPYWLGSNFDPSYAYLFNSLLIVNGEPPFHVDHPGTPVQFLGAAALSLQCRSAHAARITASTLEQPEEALHTIQLAALACTLTSLVLGGWLVARECGSIVVGIIAQCVPLLFTQSYLSQIWINAETLLFPATFLCSSFTLASVFAESSGRTDRVRIYLIGAAMAAALALTSKVTYLPFALVPIAAASTCRKKLLTVTTTLVCMGAILFPIRAELSRMASWFVHLSSSAVAGAESASTKVHNLADSAFTLAKSAPLLPVFILTALVAGLVLKLYPRLGTPDRRSGSLLLVAAAAQLAAITIVAAKPALHYLLPSFVFSSFAAVLIAKAIPALPRPLAITFTASCVAVFLYGLRSVVGQNQITTSDLAARRVAQLSAYQFAQTTATSIRIDYYRSSTPEYALHFGNGYARQH